MIKKSEPKVSIVIVNWNGKEDTFELLESLKKISYKNFNVIVVDNNSSENISDGFKNNYSNFATLIENKKNFGLAEGTNIGMREALRRKSDYVLVMNNDMYVEKKFLNFLVDSMERHPEVAVAGPTIYYKDPTNMIWSAGCDYKLRGFRSRYQRKIDLGNKKKGEFVDAIDCVLMMRSKVLKEIGLLDSSLFIIHELTGWCLKASKKNYKMIYVPKSKVWHKVSSSLNRSRSQNIITTYYDVRNWLLVNKKNESLSYFIFILLYQSTIIFFIRLLKYIKNKQLNLIKTHFIATWHAITNKTPLELYS